MILESLIARTFRNLVEREIHFHPRVNLVLGDNGQGKTNLLEAIYFLATTRSFRTTHLASLFRFGTSTMFVQGRTVNEGVTRTISVGLDWTIGRRRELLVQGERESLHDYVRHVPLVAYSSARLQIVRGGPDERRRFLDRGVAMLRPGYLEELSRYQRALRQRNSVLQQVAQGRARVDELEAWDAEWLESAIPIVRARAEYSDKISELFRRIAAEHDYRIGEFRIEYHPSGLELEGGRNSEILRSLRRREKAAGYSLIGPQRDDLELLIDGRPMGEVLSGGEIKTAVLFLKFAKIVLFAERYDEPPILLLDDIDAELDLRIIQRVYHYLAGRLQLFTTSAKEVILQQMKLPSYRRISLEKGNYTSVSDEGS